MKCPYCGGVCADDALYCPSCKQPLPTAQGEARAQHEKRREKRTAGQKALSAVFVVLFAVALVVGAFKLVGWIKSYQLTRLYTRGAYAPTLSEIHLDDMRQGHAMIFFGKDGDQIYVPELQRSLSISGGVARMEMPDSDWFTNNVTDVEYADITLSPMLISESGKKTELPQFNFQVDVPVSPLNVTSPAQERTTVVTGVYPLTLNVVPGSTVFVNGEDVTDSLDRSGYMSTYVSVKPIGDNVITLIVRTPKHRECRRELVIFRQHYDIEVELDTTVSNTSPSRTMAVTGTIEPGASIAGDTDRPLLLRGPLRQLRQQHHPLPRHQGRQAGRRDRAERGLPSFPGRAVRTRLGHGLPAAAHTVRELALPELRVQGPDHRHLHRRRRPQVHGHGRGHRRAPAGNPGQRDLHRQPDPGPQLPGLRLRGRPAPLPVRILPNADRPVHGRGGIVKLGMGMDIRSNSIPNSQFINIVLIHTTPLHSSDNYAIIAAKGRAVAQGTGGTRC